MIGKSLIKNSLPMRLSYHLLEQAPITKVDDKTVMAFEQLCLSAKMIKANDNFYNSFEYITPELMARSSFQSLIDYLADFTDILDGRFLKRQLLSNLDAQYKGLISTDISFELRSQPHLLKLELHIVQELVKGFDVVIIKEEQNYFPGSIDLSALAVLNETSTYFLPRLVSYLSEIFTVDAAFVALLSVDQFTIHSGICRGSSESLINGPLLGSPFESFSDSDVGSVYHENSFHPYCEWWVKAKAPHMLMLPIKNLSGVVLGVVGVMHSNQISCHEKILDAMAFFSNRLATELNEIGTEELSLIKQEHYRALVEKSVNGMFVVDVDPPMPVHLSVDEQARYIMSMARFSEANSAFLELHGLSSKSELIGQLAFDLASPVDLEQRLNQFINNYYYLDSSLRAIERQDGKLWLSSTFNGHVENGCLTYVYAVCSDVTERIYQTEQLAHQATHDELTQLPNRDYFRKEVDRTINELQAGESVALFILDLDGFKEINDTLGHLTGDDLLAMIGPRLALVLDEHEVFLSRLGGDEFGLLVKDAGDESALIDVAILIMSAIKTSFTVNNLDLCIGGSVGISYYPYHGEDFTSLMRCADIAMYRAKALSKDFEIYQAEDDHFSVKRLSLMMDMRNAIEDGQLVLHYQPITYLHNKQIKGFEALVRWNHPLHGLIPPSDFIPLIELTDTIEPLTWWVIETAIKQLRQWQLEGKEYILSVNVSTRNISDDSFVYRLSRLLRTHKVDGRFLEIEITESTLMADPVKGRSVLKAMASMGIRFAIDDFGTGYSSLAYLKSLPINVLKIDRAFIANMLQDEQDQIIVNSTIQLAHNLGMKVTAEGIEDPRLIAELADLGCDFGQGYFICRPVPCSELEAWISLYERGNDAVNRVNKLQ